MLRNITTMLLALAGCFSIQCNAWNDTAAYAPHERPISYNSMVYHAKGSYKATTDRTVFCNAISRNNLYISISKKHRTLFVYEQRPTATTLIAAYPICLGASYGNKRAQGDMRTPESIDGIPFTISEIVDASQWKHDFNDGRGTIPAYGRWFLRLKGRYVGSGIGIHGSTGNRYSVPGRASEGCVRMRDEDIEHLTDNYAYVGMPVYIESDKINN